MITRRATELRLDVTRKIQSTWGIPFYSKGHGLELTVYLRVEAQPKKKAEYIAKVDAQA